MNNIILAYGTTKIVDAIRYQTTVFGAQIRFLVSVEIRYLRRYAVRMSHNKVEETEFGGPLATIDACAFLGRTRARAKLEESGKEWPQHHLVMKSLRRPRVYLSA
jgi:hypothetical protein